MRKISLHSRRKLKATDAERFAQLEPALFVELAKVVCSTGMLPQKELHEVCGALVCLAAMLRENFEMRGTS